MDNYSGLGMLILVCLSPFVCFLAIAGVVYLARLKSNTVKCEVCGGYLEYRAGADYGNKQTTICWMTYCPKCHTIQVQHVESLTSPCVPMETPND